jgi:hypothetical protein
MQTLSTDSNKNRALLTGGLAMVLRNKRYILWFWLLNLVFGAFGTSAFHRSAGAVLDHSLYSGRLLHGFDLSVMLELFMRPEFGPMAAMTTPAFYFACAFLLATALFLPGVFQGYASSYRLPREDFFRACGRNLWRFVRLMILAGIVMGVIAWILLAINGKLVEKAGESTRELLPFEVQMTGLAVIFLVMTTLRIWFDLAEADIVLNDQRAVRKSIAAAFRHTFRSLWRLLPSYVVATVAAAIFLVGGLWAWIRFVPSDSLIRAFLLSQLILLLLLIPRFWQRGVAVSYWQQRMLTQISTVQAPTQSTAPESSPAGSEVPPSLVAPDVPPTP